ncbi:MAG: hypothetical protein U1C51_07110 [Candidatus Izemoplasmatales bacterium]|nr:hypothetical protein [Candidatus Izemoplasmatales bacterium]
MNALRDSFRSAILHDVISRYQIRNATVLEKLIQYVFSNVGKTFSALSISKYFKSQRVNVSVDTILSYLSMIQDAFLIYKVSRNDLIGKKSSRQKKNIILPIMAFVKRSQAAI